MREAHEEAIKQEYLGFKNDAAAPKVISILFFLLYLL
jgi:hypothetical protein